MNYTSIKSNDTGCVPAALIIPVGILAAITNGWAASLMWAWFVVPVFDAPALSIAQAVGISCLVTLFRSNTSSRSSGKDSATVIAEMLAVALVAPVVAVGFAWVVKLFL